MAPKTAAELLAALANLPPVDEDVLARLDEIQRTDLPPDDPWESVG